MSTVRCTTANTGAMQRHVESHQSSLQKSTMKKTLKDQTTLTNAFVNFYSQVLELIYVIFTVFILICSICGNKFT